MNGVYFRSINFSFYSCFQTSIRDYKKENYSLDAIEIFKAYCNKSTINNTINNILEKEIILRNLKEQNSLLDPYLVDILSGDLSIDIKETNRNGWLPYQYSLEYMRTILVQTASEKFIDDEEFMESIMNCITAAIIFCITKGENNINDYYLDNIEFATLRLKRYYDTQTFII